MLLHICQNPHAKTKREPWCELWPLGDPDVSKNVPRGWGMLTAGKATPAQGQELEEDALYLLLSFVVNVKLLQKIVFF